MKETESKRTMMMMVREAVNAQLMYQQSCNGLHEFMMTILTMTIMLIIIGSKNTKSGQKHDKR